jgi:hypothetical protein
MTLIPNKIKFVTSATTGTIKAGNFILGINDNITYGPTSVSGFYQGLSPVFSGYTVYQNKVSGGPSTFRPNNDSEFIGLAKALGGTNVTGVTDGLVYLNSQSSIIAVNRDYEDIVTSGLTLNLDAGFTPSYRRSGTTWTDLSFSGNNGVLTNGPTFSFSGSGSIVFDGVDDYVNIPTSITMGSQNTVIGFIKLSGTNSDTVVFCPEANGVDNWLGIQSNRILLYATEISDVNNFAIQGITNLDTSDSIWYQIVSTINNNVATIYLNGVQENTVTKNFTIGSWTSNANLGRRGGFSQTRYFKGSISSVQVYNRVLSPTEIVQNYQAQFPRFLGENIVSNGLVFYVDAGYRPSYPTTGTTWYDVSGLTGKTATLFNGPTYSSANGGSILYDGTDDYVRLPTNNGLQPSSELTLEVWFKSLGNNSKTQGLLYLNYGTGLRLEPNGSIHIRINSSGSLQTFITTSTYFNNSWNQATLTIKSNTAILYVNSTIVDQYSITYNGSSPFDTSIGGVGTDSNDSANRGFYGNISIARVYNRVLNQSEITQNFNAQKSRYGL